MNRGGGENYSSANFSPESEVRSGIRSLAPIYLQPGDPTIRYLSPQILFRSNLMAAGTSNVALHRPNGLRAIRHTIRCNAAAVFRAWHDLGTRTLDAAIVISAERLDGLLPMREGTVWRVFGIRLHKGRATITSCAAVLTNHFAIVDRSKETAIDVARWYWREVGISDWRNVMTWPDARLVSVTNVSIDRTTGLMELAGIGRRDDTLVLRRDQSRWICKICPVVRSEDGAWVYVNHGEVPEEALERYWNLNDTSDRIEMAITEEDMEAIELSTRTTG